MTGRTQEELVAAQFDSHADAYLKSPIHAKGEDLPALTAIVQGRRDAILLDLGCGSGHVSFAVAPHVASVTACDLSSAMLEIVAREAAERGLTNIVTHAGAAEALPFPNATFDIVMSRLSAHYWRDFVGGLREVARVLKPGGVATFVDVVSPGVPVLDSFLQTMALMSNPSHVREYSTAEWLAATKEAGFSRGRSTRRRLRLEFAPWIDRHGTPPLLAEAIRALQQAVAEPVRAHFQIEPDGSFTVDTLLLEVTKV
jgi:ubiquinone/menaquinone biosynthesis C-methylase UbiE